MLLLGDPENHRSGPDLASPRVAGERFARGQRTDTEHRQALMDDVVADGRRFYAAARRDLGIASGDITHRGSWESHTDPALEPPATTATGTDSA